MDTMKLNKIAAAILLAGVVAMMASLVTRLIHPAYGGGHAEAHGENRVLAAYVKTDDGAAAVQEAPKGPEPIEALLASADLANGEKVFKKCASCHTVNQGGSNKQGPALWSVVGNDKAAIDGFKYSSAMSEAPGEWTYDALNQFLYKPKDYVKGTKMVFAGLRRTSDRADLIAFLRAQDDAPEPLPE